MSSADVWVAPSDPPGTQGEKQMGDDREYEYMTKLYPGERLAEVKHLREENENTTRLLNEARAEIQRLRRNGTTVQLFLHGLDADTVARVAEAASRPRNTSPCPPGFVCAEHERVGR